MNDEEQEDVQDESLRDTLEAAVEEVGASEEPADEAPAAEEIEEPAVEATAEAEPAEQPVEGAPKPPVDWDAGLREGWDSLPEGVKKKVLEREKQVNDLMQETAGARRAAGQMNQLFSTYGSLLAAEGASDPLQATATLFQTVSELRMGSPAQKAQKMAQLIQTS